jgi:predicted Zn-dependent peptidase
MFRLAVTVSALAVMGSVRAQAQMKIEYEDYALDNGLRVLLVEDHSAPVVTVNVWYNVGSRNERVGRSGFAHLFEHMMFQGSANVGKGEHFQLVERAGGSMNGSTNEGRTNYYETLPSNRLNLGLWLEADRMRSLAVTEDNFENQRSTVKEERRLGVDNQPYAPAFTEGSTLIYDSTDCFSYAHSVIGSMDDLDRAEVPDVQAFFDLYYRPNNATLTVVGDFDPAEAKQLIGQYFDDIQRGAEPPRIACNYDFEAGARSRTWDDQHANLPAVIVAYRAPPHSHGDTRPLTFLSTILGEGESSRLNRGLVRDEQSSVQAASFLNSRRGPGMFLALAIANQGVEADVLREQLNREVERIISEGISDAELEKAKNAFRASYVFQSQTSMQIAERLQHYIHYHDSLDDMATDLELYMQVTAEDIQRVAAEYLKSENSYTIIIVPKAGSGEEVVP